MVVLVHLVVFYQTARHLVPGNQVIIIYITFLFMLSLVPVRKRSYSSSSCPTYQVTKGKLIGKLSGSPPFKRVQNSFMPPLPELDDQVMTVEVSSPASTLDKLVRDAHVQYHDRMRGLHRDCQLMARRFLALRDERISFYTRNFPSSGNITSVDPSDPEPINLNSSFDLELNLDARSSHSD